MKKIIPYMLLIIIASCCSSRDSQGRYWKARDVVHRILAKKGINQTSCPIVKNK